jgi:outer membrane lipoprotein SlyB
MQLKHALSTGALVLAAVWPLALTSTVHAQTGSAVSATTIADFQVEPVDRLWPGTVLAFSLDSTPGASVTLKLTGAKAAVPMTERRPGHYEGSYTIRQQDRLRGALVADGTLTSDGRMVKQRLDHQATGSWQPAPVAACANCGGVVSVTQVEVQDDSPNVIGTIAGGLLGGVLGHQVGGGRGRDLATVIGAVGGAYAGNRVENNIGQRKVFRVAVRLDGGTTQSFDYADDPAVTVGTRVKVENGVLIRL